VTLEVRLVSPERVLYTGQARVVQARTVDGELAFLTGHAPLIGALDIGLVRIGQESGEDEVAAVHGGFVEVKDDVVTILSDVAELSGQVDVARAREAKSRAEAELRTDAGNDEAAAALARAEARLAAAG
jgi:F-type H+-transporting ATPase subunit epsilon